MMRYLISGLVIGFLTVILLALMVTFVTQSSSSISTGSFSVWNAIGVIVLYGVAMAIIGALVDQLTRSKKKK